MNPSGYIGNLPSHIETVPESQRLQSKVDMVRIDSKTYLIVLSLIPRIEIDSNFPKYGIFSTLTLFFSHYLYSPSVWKKAFMS